MLEINNLHASIHDKAVLKGVNLTIKQGEVHAIMGPNGSGKSTLSNILSGKAHYTITQGTIMFQGQDISTLSPQERATLGLFLGFQYPVEIPGVATATFLRTALNSLRKARGESPLDAFDFLNLIKEKMALLDMDPAFLQRAVNEGFSGGEKKRNEMMQMLLLDPRLAILDEPDSGLDIDALQIVAKGINLFKRPDKAIVLITHYQRLLDYIQPDVVHVFSQGKIVTSGDKSLALELERKGYGWLA